MPRTYKEKAYVLDDEVVNIKLCFYENKAGKGIVAHHPYINFAVSLPDREGWEDEVKTTMEKAVLSNKKRRKGKQKPGIVVFYNPDADGDEMAMLGVATV